MCEHPLCILSRNVFIYRDKHCRFVFNGVEYDSFTSLSPITSNFLQSYRNLTCDLLYDVTKNSYILYNGKKYSLFTLLPCSRCKYCRAEYVRQIEYRSIIECSHSGTLFYFTFTYDNFHLPSDGLHKEHVSKALKSLRNYIKRYLDFDVTFTSLYCGEYGMDTSKSLRAHYHGILFVKQKLSTLQILKFKELFCCTPKSFLGYIKNRLLSEGKTYTLRNVVNMVKLLKGEPNNIYPSDFYKKHRRLLGVWPLGLRFDLSAIVNPVASVRYLTKYISKNVANSAFCDVSDYMVHLYRDGHKNDFFVQLPKSIGLGCAYLDEYRDAILCSDSFSIFVRCYDSKLRSRVYRIGIPHIFVKKLFPGLSFFLPNCTYVAHLVGEIFHEICKLKYSSPALFDCVNYSHCESIESLQSRFQPYSYLLNFTLKRYQKLRIGTSIAFIFNTLHNRDYKTICETSHFSPPPVCDVLSILKELIDFLECGLNYQDYLNLTFAKDNFYQNKKVLDVNSRRLFYEKDIKIANNEHFVSKNMCYSPFDLFR